MCCEKSVLKNCPTVTRKTPVLESLFNKVAVLQASRYFLVNIEKFLRTNFLKEHLRTAASEGSFYVSSFLSYQNSNRVREKYRCQFLQSCFPLAEVTNNFFITLKLRLLKFHLFLQRKCNFPRTLCHPGSLMLNHQRRRTRPWFVRVHI